MIQSLRKNIAWVAIPLAGLAGGTAFLLVVLVLARPWLGIDGSIILGYFAALALGSDVLLEQTGQVLLVGIAVHYALSLVFALVIAFVVHRWGMLVGVLGGAVLGLSLYGINLYTMTVWFPWFFAVNSTLLLLAHLAYGVVTGAVYELLDTFDVNRRDKTGVAHEAV